MFTLSLSLLASQRIEVVMNFSPVYRERSRILRVSQSKKIPDSAKLTKIIVIVVLSLEYCQKDEDRII